jgi:hypothetical protein
MVEKEIKRPVKMLPGYQDTSILKIAFFCKALYCNITATTVRAALGGRGVCE